MDREIPIASRIISKRILQRSNDIMVEKIMNMKVHFLDNTVC